MSTNHDNPNAASATQADSSLEKAWYPEATGVELAQRAGAVLRMIIAAAAQFETLEQGSCTALEISADAVAALLNEAHSKSYDTPESTALRQAWALSASLAESLWGIESGELRSEEQLTAADLVSAAQVARDRITAFIGANAEAVGA